MDYQFYTDVFILNLGHNVYNQMSTATFDVDEYHPCNVNLFIMQSFSSHGLRVL